MRNQQPAISNQQSADQSLRSQVSGLRSRQAFTLIELMVVIVILGGIMGALLVSFLVSHDSYLSADASIQVQEEARRALDAMVRELREASLITSPALPPTQQIDFQIARGYNIPTAPGCAAYGAGICWGDETAGGRWVHYAVDAANVRLMRCTTAAGPGGAITNFTGCRVLANNVSTALATTTSFTYNNANRTVDMSLGIQITNPQLPGGSMALGGTPASPSLKSRVQRRNTP